MRVEENILNIFNMKEEVDKIYKKLINWYINTFAT